MENSIEHSSLDISARLNSLPPALDYLEQLARNCGFDTRETLAIRLALEETLLNTVQHAYPDTDEGRIKIICNIQQNGIRYIIRDKGIPFDPSINDPDHESLGMRLINHSMSKVYYHNRGRQGREVELLKYLPSTHIKNICPVEPEKPQEQTPHPPQQASSTVRRLQDEDALEVSRCAYLTYGYGYEDYIYYPDQIKSMNDDGTLISVVAVNDQGEFMGHAAAKKVTSQENLRELGVLLVAPQFRSTGIAKKLSQKLFEEIQKTETKSVFCRAVAGHTISQKLAEKDGLKATALLLAMLPQSLEIKKLTKKMSHRMSCLILWKPLTAPRKRNLFIPQKHRYWIERLYKELKLPWLEGHQQENTAQDRTSSKNVLAGSMTDIFNIGEIDIEHCAAETLVHIRHTIQQLCLKKVDVIYLYLNLEDQQAPELTQMLEEDGCFFTGIMPDRFFNGDALVLQYLNNTRIDYEQIKVTDGYPQELLRYIQSLDPLNSV